MDRLTKVKKVIRDNIAYGNCGLYDCRNLVGDPMETIYNDGDVIIDICYGYAYFEVFGLSKDEFAELREWYADAIIE